MSYVGDDKSILVLNSRHLGFSAYSCLQKLETADFGLYETINKY